MALSSFTVRSPLGLQMGPAVKNLARVSLLLFRLLVAGYGVLLLWRFYPGVSVTGIALFLGMMIVLFLALPMVPRAGVSNLWRWSWWSVYAFGFVSFAILRAFCDEGRPVFYNYPIRFGDGLFGTPAPVLLQQLLPDPSRHNPITLLMVVTYISYFIVPTTVALYLGRRRSEHFSRYVVATFSMYLIGLIVYRLVPTAPPWMAARDGIIPPLDRISALIIHPDTYAQGLHLIGSNDVAAMPSIHVAGTWLAIFGLWFRGRWARILGVVYGCLMMFAVVYLGEHWVVDAVAGLGLSCSIWYATRTLAPLKWPAVRRIRAGFALATGLIVSSRQSWGYWK